MTHANVWFDGACRGNPGAIAGGAILEIEGVRKDLHGAKGHGTNNEAEYDGVILGLEAALDAGAITITLRGDSQLVIRQLEGKYQVKAQNLRPRFERAKALLSRFQWVEFEWVRREQNAAADQAANDALDA